MYRDPHPPIRPHGRLGQERCEAVDQFAKQLKHADRLCA
jgi:hypothetical protein